MDIETKAIYSTADFSKCDKYRYTLSRLFDYKGNGALHFCMLNPSTANGDYNDPTIARCEKRAIEGGYSALIVTNLFAFRATNPKDMMKHYSNIDLDEEIAVYAEEKEAIIAAMLKSHKTIFAWGNLGTFKQRDNIIISALMRDYEEELHKVYHLGLNKSEQPKHPLYIRADKVAERFF